MSGSDWRSFTKLLGLGLAGLGAFLSILFVGYALGLSGGYYDAQADGYAAQYKRETDQHIRECFTVSVAPSGAAECVEKAIQASHENRLAEQDLSAQRQMAQWSWWLLIVALGQMPLTAIGLVFLLRTIWQGQEANVIARESVEADVRAWLRIRGRLVDAQMTSLGFALSFEVELRNFGRSPATSAWVAIVYYGRTSWATKCKIVDREFSHQPFGPIFPDDSVTETFQLNFSNKQIAELTKKAAKDKSGSLVIIELTCEYSTIFEEHDTVAEHRSRIGYSVNFNGPAVRSGDRQDWFKPDTVLEDLNVWTTWIDDTEPT